MEEHCTSQGWGRPWYFTKMKRKCICTCELHNGRPHAVCGKTAQDHCPDEHFFEDAEYYYRRLRQKDNGDNTLDTHGHDYSYGHPGCRHHTQHRPLTTK